MSEAEDLRRLLEHREKEYEEAKKRFDQLKKTIRRNYEGVVQLLTEVISLSNRFLGGHLKRCAEITRAFSTHMQHPRDVVFLHYYSALLHDIGLIGKDLSLTTLPRNELDGEQWDTYEKHPAEGEEIIGSIYNLKRTAAVIRAHHERYDGTGFPDHLTGDAIPYGGRIVALANDWDLLLFKRKFAHEDAIDYIREGRGSLYDPGLAESFLSFITEWTEKRGNRSTSVSLDELKPGMYLEEDLVLSNGLLLVPNGMVLDPPTISKIHSFSSMLGGRKRFKVVF